MDESTKDQGVRALQILVAAFALGVVSFAIVALLLQPNIPPQQPDIANILLVVLLAVGLFQVPAYWLLRQFTFKQLREAHRSQAGGGAAAGVDATFPPAPLRGLVTLGAAFAEGFALFGVVIYFVTGNWIGLAAGGIGVALVLAQFPTRERLERFLEAARESGI
jgi:hypothetical protein